MDLVKEKEKASVVQNIAGEHHKVVGGNTFYGDAHITIHGDTTTSKKEEEKPNFAGPLDPEVEQMLTKLNLMSLKNIFIEEELTISDLTKITNDQLMKIGVQKIKHRLAITEEVARILDAASKCTGTITLHASGAAAEIWSECLGSFEAIEEKYQGAAVYRNNKGKYLYRESDGTWRVTFQLGDDCFKSVDTTALCPASISQWRYMHYGWYTGDITAQCSVHT